MVKTNKIKLYFIIICSILLCIFATPMTLTTPAHAIGNEAVIVFSGEQNNDIITITASLPSNDGIQAMQLYLNYDSQTMTYLSHSRGSALSTLSLTATGETEKENIAFNFLGAQNDTSTGDFLIMQFRLNDNIQDGTYKIGFFTKDAGCTYLDNNKVCTKTLYIDTAEIVVKDNALYIEILSPTPTNNTVLIIAISIVSVALVGAIVYAVISFNKNRKKEWEKYE